jgi:aminopeptidase N
MTNADDFGGVFSDNGVLYAVGVGFRNNYVGTTQHWLACYDHPSDKATFDFNFITPRNLTVASNGILDRVADTTIDGGNYKITRWVSSSPIATYLMTFACSDYVSLNFAGSDYPAVVYCKPEDSSACRFVFKKVTDMVNGFERYYGKYPFAKVGYVITPLSGGAMEHQTMITMNSSYINKLYSHKDTMNMTAAHELSHQWFGDAVTPFDFRDAWFNEGFATFSEGIWHEINLGFKRYLDFISERVNQYVNIFSGYEGVLSLYDFSRVPPSSNYPITIYYKGAAVVALLRYELGDEVFFGALKKLISQSNYGNISAKSLQEFLEEYSKKDLDWFFKQWIYGKGYPVLNVTTFKSESNAEGYYKAEIHIKQVQSDEWGTYTHLPVNFTFADINGNRVSKTLVMNSREQVFYLDSLPDFHSPLINRGDSVRTLLKIEHTVTSVERNVNDLDVKIYPNPANNTIYVDFAELPDIKSIQVINLNGRILKQFPSEVLPKIGLLKIGLENLSSGLYFLQVETNNIIKTLTFIKQ